MHMTHVIMKNGDEYASPLLMFRPHLGWFVLMEPQMRLNLDDMVSAITEDERLPGGEIGPCDELARARKLMQAARRNGWFGLKQDTPLQKWEKED